MAYKDLEARKRYARLWKREQRRRAKIKAVAMLGGSCKRCGYSTHVAALEIDHLVLKRRNLPSTGGNQATKVANGKIPINEVQLLCANCHAIKTYEEDRMQFSSYINED